MHFGPLSVQAPAGGKFGGVGVMIDSPRVILSVHPAAADLVLADEATRLRVTDFLRRIRQALSGQSFPGCEITVTQTIPSHRGLGSGTQLALAVARATSIFAGEGTLPLEQLARRVGRGLRSAIGLYGFDRGGFLVDGGRKQTDQLGTLISRVEFPSAWRFVLATPRETIGLSGEAEQSTFAKQPPMPVTLTAELCRVVLMDWLPSIIEADFDRCSEAMQTFGQAVGEFFSAAQGGVIAHPAMAKWAELLSRRGIPGVAQTSWGPTVAALCESDSIARQVQRDFATDPAWNECAFEVVRPLNQGASVIID